MMSLLAPFAIAAAAPAAALPPMPQNMAAVPVIEGWQGRRVSPQWSETVERLYRRGDCQGAVPYEGSWLLEVDMLFLVSGDGKPLRIAPVNARCEPVETFVSKRVLGSLSHSFPKSGAAEPQWMRSQVRFLWSDAP